MKLLSALSIYQSGSDYSSIQYTFLEDNYPDVVYKNVVYGSTCNLRPYRKSMFSDNEAIIFPNPFSDKFEISLSGNNVEIFSVRIVNLIGKEIYNILGNESEINNNLNYLAIKLNKGVYFLQLQSVETKEILLEKLVKM